MVNHYQPSHQIPTMVVNPRMCLSSIVLGHTSSTPWDVWYVATPNLVAWTRCKHPHDVPRPRHGSRCRWDQNVTRKLKFCDRSHVKFGRPVACCSCLGLASITWGGSGSHPSDVNACFWLAHQCGTPTQHKTRCSISLLRHLHHESHPMI